MRPEGLFEANQFILHALQPYNNGIVEENATITNNVGIGRNTVLPSRTTIMGLAIIGDHCDIGPKTYIGPYTSIGDHTTIMNAEVENTIMRPTDCGRRIVDSLIGRKVKILGYEQNIPRGRRLILGDMAIVTL